MTNPLNDAQKKKGQSALILFQTFNGISFCLMSGNIIALYALKIGANTYFVGLLNSFISFSMVMMIIGKMLVPRYGILSIFRTFWALRYVSMIPAIFSAFIYKENPSLALFLLGTGVFLFSVSRGIGFTGFSPMMASVASENDRGGFFSLIQLVFHLCGLIVGIMIIFILHLNKSVYMYTIFIGIGIITGVMASVPLFFFPKGSDLDYVENRHGKLIPGFFKAIKDLTENLKLALKRVSFNKYLKVNISIFFLFALIDPFIIVFFKKVYHMPDSLIALFVIIGSLGAIVNSYMSKKYIDIIGAKITLFIFSCIYCLIVFLLMIAPHTASYPLWIYAGIIFFISKFCSTGMSTSTMIYLFGVIDPKEHLNLSIIQQMSCGMAGFIGGNIGGVILQTFENHIQLSLSAIYRIYFGSLILFFIWLSFSIAKMHNAGGYSVRELFSKLSFGKIFNSDIS